MISAISFLAMMGLMLENSIPFQNIAKGGGMLSDKQMRRLDTATITEKEFVIFVRYLYVLSQYFCKIIKLKNK